MGKNKENKDGKIGVLTGVAYGCGDAACNVVFAMISSLLVLFYTDYAGIPAATVGIVMLVSRCFDGVSDFIMGWIVSKTKSRFGQSRPWILRMCIPYSVGAVLMFLVPEGSLLVKTIYIFVTYNFVTTICYTAINLPYGSLSIMMTRDSQERAKLATYRMAISPIGRIVAVSCSLPLVKVFGDDKMAWVKTMTIWAVLALVLLLFCFARCKETVDTSKRAEQHITLGQNIKALAVNQYFWVGMVLWALQGVVYTISGTMLPYYCKYIFHNDTLYSPLYFVEQVVCMAFVMLCPFFSKKMAKNKVIIIGAFILIAGQLLLMSNPNSFQICMVSTVLRAIGMSPLNGYVFVMIGDAVEFGQWKTHIRQESFVFSSGSVGAKVGMGVASAALSGIMAASGYISSSNGAAVTQPASAVSTIQNLFIWGPILVFAAVAVICAFYKLDKKYPVIMQELAEREARGEM